MVHCTVKLSGVNTDMAGVKVMTTFPFRVSLNPLAVQQRRLSLQSRNFF